MSINAVFEHPSITKCVFIWLTMIVAHSFSFARLAKLIVLLSSGKDVEALQTNPQELMLKLVDKYSHFTYPPKVHASGTNEDNTSGKVVRTMYPSTLTHGVFTVPVILSLGRLDGCHGLAWVVHSRRAPRGSGRGDCLLSLSC